jgi:hypothetical protein
MQQKGRDAEVLTKTVPANLKAMLGVQKSLFSYLKTRAIDPKPNIASAIKELERG